MLSPIESGMQHRTQLLLGPSVAERISKARVLIFGVGGVGSWCAEGLVRSGIRHITLVDSDCVCLSNLNRQLMATTFTVGQVKVEALRERLLQINPSAEIQALQMIYDAETSASFHMEEYDFVIDAIDSLAEKAHLILTATALPKNITFVSSMGAALRTDPFKVCQAEFWNVKGDPLARALRNRFKRNKQFPARKFLCVYSEQPPLPNLGNPVAEDVANSVLVDVQGKPELAHHDWTDKKAQVNGSLCHITAIFGMSIAGIVINKLSKVE